MQTVSLSFYRFGPWYDRVWAFAMMGLARPFVGRMPGIGFWKLCGSGVGEGFTPIPNTGVYAILATWPDAETAARQTREGRVYQWYRKRAAEQWTVLMATTGARGAWSGQMPFESGPAEAPDRPLAALTRATIRPKAALGFWGRVPNISEVIGADPNVVFKIGIGEVPLLHQVTFSIWPDARSMAEFARRDGPHARAIKAVRDNQWFREELYARFQILGAHGTWEGRDPLAKLGRASDTQIAAFAAPSDAPRPSQVAQESLAP